jgi:hypothetical protein
LPDIATVAPGAFDRFILDLVEAGFETTDGRTWSGPLDASLAGVTSATSMRIRIENGWPYRHPHVYVEGLRPSVHLNGTGLCLWRVGDDSLAWLRLDDLRARIAQWAERYRGRATLEDPGLDAHLYWESVNSDLLATVDLSKINWGNGGSGDLRASIDRKVLAIGEQGDLRVRWYGRDDMRHPPVNLGMVTDGLKPEQARNLERQLDNVGRDGGPNVLMLVWATPVGEPNVLVLRLRRDDAAVVRAESIEVARIDTDVLIRRAGPDAAALRTKSVLVFGQGAIGSNVTLLLARSGVGNFMVVDGERLRPGDLVRHAADKIWTGRYKVIAVTLDAEDVAPWTKVRPINDSSWDPDAIRQAFAGMDLVIDAVGEESFTNQLSRAAADANEPILSIALYRGGAVARARLRSAGGTPIHERADSTTFPVIPPGPREPVTSWETGCASPVNNAPPVAVMSAAALASRLAVDVLTGREAGNCDAIEVYQPLDAEGFDLVGYFRHDG